MNGVRILNTKVRASIQTIMLTASQPFDCTRQAATSSRSASYKLFEELHLTFILIESGTAPQPEVGTISQVEDPANID